MRRPEGRGHLAAGGLAVLSLCSCAARTADLSEAARREVARPYTPGIAAFLPAAGEEEFTGLLTQPVPEPVVEVPAERAGRFGLRLGYLATVTAEEMGWSPAVCAGVYYRRAKPPSPRAVFEVGFDYVPLERADGSVSTTLYLIRGEMLFGKWNTEERTAGLYLLGGCELVGESSILETSGSDDTGFQPGVNIGLGIGSTKGAWDVRAVYSLFPGSPNVNGNALVVAGFSF